MRLNSSALGLLLPVAALLSGCAMGNSGSALSSAAVRPSKAITGKAYGGQSPVSGGTIALYAFGNTGYGSGAAPIVSVQAGADGYFTIDPGSITCPTANTPVYLLSIGGDPGFGPNSAILEGAALGPCGDVATDFVTINEISTAALAYAFAHFFSAAPVSGDTVTNDHFGAPANSAQTIINSNSTVYTMLDVPNGYPHPNTSTFQFESAKLITVANILGACVNTNGPSSTACSDLFSDITGPNGATPTNTLEAAVYLALNPTQNVGAIFNLQPMAGGNPAFDGGLTAAPFDWSLSASYTSPSFSLGVNTRTASTIDIDTAGRVWFPSNGPGQAGVGYFDPSTATFSPLFTSNLTHPQQVAIDVDNYVWVTDSSSPNVAGFPASSPNAPVALSLPGTTSTSVTVAYDNSIAFGIIAPDGQPGLAKVNGKDSYAEQMEVPGGGGFIASSVAGDVVGGYALAGQELRTPTTYDLYLAPNNGPLTFITYQTFQDAGQVVFTGNNFVGTRGGYSAPDDGICIWSAQGCFAMANQAVRHPSGLAIDGAGSLWLADQSSFTVEQIPFTNGSYLTSGNQANNVVFDHDPNNGGTLPAPTGIAVDGAGNVWVSNYGCYGNGCTPGSFTLSEIIGLGTPTINPVSRQVVINDLAGTEPQKKTGATGAK